MKYDTKLYDLDPRSFLKEEVSFYLKLVEKFKPKNILELGVGSGRIFSKLLNKVVYGVGVDISDNMLDVCRKTCDDKRNYELINLNFINFNLNQKFDLIYMPFNTFQHLLSVEDQTKCLVSIKRHMDKNSFFILDVMDSDNIVFELNNWKLDYSTKLPNGNILKREQKTLKVNKKTHVFYKQFRYQELGKNKELKDESVFDALMKITPNQKLEKLLNRFGFEIVNKWSNYHFKDSVKTKKIIYCLKAYENH
ncbi:class I SAM-dependent methyltransferase [Candidatus Parcubacteria bacterium]|nr:class I SAM-dependent methyltransferase [Candidatus Parcubacteria bacterium]